MGFAWWCTAFDTPFFADELEKCFFEKLIKKREIWFYFMDFGLYLGALAFVLSQNLRGYLRMPFVLWWEFASFDFNENYAEKLRNLGVNFSKNSAKNGGIFIDKSWAFELYYNALKAHTKRRKLSRAWKFAILPYRIYRAKIRCKKGNFRAQRECGWWGFYAKNA